MTATVPRRAATWCAIVMAALLILGTGVVFGLAAPSPARAADDPAATLLEMTNQTRNEKGLVPLVAADSLAAIAQAWAEHQADTGSLVHNPSVSDQLPEGWTLWGENIARGQGADAAGMQQMWLNSEGHYANIVGASFTVMGSGFAVSEDGTAYGVELFAAYKDPTVAGAAPVAPPAAEEAPPAPAAEAPAEDAAAAEPAPAVEPEDSAALAQDQKVLAAAEKAAATGGISQRTLTLIAAAACAILAAISAVLFVLLSRRRPLAEAAQGAPQPAS